MDKIEEFINELCCKYDESEFEYHIEKPSKYGFNYDMENNYDNEVLITFPQNSNQLERFVNDLYGMYTNNPNYNYIENFGTESGDEKDRLWIWWRTYWKSEKTMEKIVDIAEWHGFEYLDENIDKEAMKRFVKLEYTGDDIIYKDENDFNDKLEYDKFSNEQGEITMRHFLKVLDELKKEKIEFVDYEWDYCDYPCVWVELGL